MNLLDDDRRRRRIDPEDVLRAYLRLPDQAREASLAARRLSLKKLGGIRRIVISGMGGSALGPHVIKSVFAPRLPLPVELARGYRLPAGVDRSTLVILSSYSGNTEETLAVAELAHRRKAKIIGLCAGGKLATRLKKWRLPVYVFDTRFNPGGRPRMALGYSIFGVLGLLAHSGVLRIKEKEVSAAITVLRKSVRRFSPTVPFARNPAKKMAWALREKFSIFVAAEHLEGSAHTLANQTNETAKQLAAWFALPELNHHLMEGLAHPATLVAKTTFVFLDSSLYHPRVQKRLALTAEVVKKNRADAMTYRPASKTLLGQAAELLALGGALSYYLAIENRENPSPTKWVDWFKRRLAG